MKFNRKFRERGQMILLIIGLICFIASHFVGEKADALLNMVFALCVFGVILLDILCRRRRPDQPIWNRRARINILWAGLYLLIFAIHTILVLAEVRLPAGIRTVMSLLGLVSLAMLLFHDSAARKSRKKPAARRNPPRRQSKY